MHYEPTQSEIFQKLLHAYHRCKKGKHKSFEVLKFESRLGGNLQQLSKALFNKTYHPKPLKCFVVSHPKPREIFAGCFQDRLVNHLIVEPLEKIWEPKFSPSSYACRKNMGPLTVLKDIQKSVRSISRGGQKEAWALHLDIKSFFVTIDRNILKNLFLSKAQNPWLRNLIEIVLAYDGRIGSYIIEPEQHKAQILPEKSWYSQGPHQGVPIGSLTSQFGSNLYLNELDQFINRQLRPKKYIRYMDDLLFLDTDQEILETLPSIISEWLRNNRNQDLNHNKTKLVSLKDGLTYLGVICKQTDLTKEPLQIFPTKKRKWEFTKAVRNCEHSEWHWPERCHPLAFPNKYQNQNVLTSVNSHLGLLKHANTFKLRKESLTKALAKTTLNNNEPDEVASKYSPLKIKKNFSVLTWK